MTSSRNFIKRRTKDANMKKVSRILLCFTRTVAYSFAVFLFLFFGLFRCEYLIFCFIKRQTIVSKQMNENKHMLSE